MHWDQYAIGFVHFSLQTPLECTCTAVLWPKIFETSLFRWKTNASLCISGAPGAPNELQSLVSGCPKSAIGCSFALENGRIPCIGTNMPLDSSTLAFQTHLNAHALPFCGPNFLKPHFSLGNTDEQSRILWPKASRWGSTTYPRVFIWL